MPDKKPRGFAAISPERRREIAAMGGRRAHETGRAHRWTPEEASAAGKTGARVALERGVTHRWTSAEAADAGRKGGTESGRVRRGRKSAADD